MLAYEDVKADIALHKRAADAMKETASKLGREILPSLNAIDERMSYAIKNAWLDGYVAGLKAGRKEKSNA